MQEIRKFSLAFRDRCWHVGAVHRRGAIRLKEIAAKAGVHPGTVSSVLSASGKSGTRVSVKTAERIRKIASEIGYIPNRYAQMMRMKRSRIIGVLEFGMSSELSMHRTISVGKAVREMGYDLLASNVLWYPEGVEKALPAMLAMKVEGIILSSPSEWLPENYLGILRASGIPLVSFHGVHLPGIPQVRQDALQPVQDLTRHLISLGRRRLTFLSRWSSLTHSEVFSWPILERSEGFRRAILEAGGSVVDRFSSSASVDGPPEGVLQIGETGEINADPIDLGFRAANTALDGSPRPDALVCSNDEWAIGAMGACSEKGLRVPEDVAVTGVGNLKITRFTSPPLTTADFRSPAAGKIVVETLLQMINSSSSIPRDWLKKLPSELVIRRSCGTALTEK